MTNLLAPLRTDAGPLVVNDALYCAARHCHGEAVAEGEHGYACTECGLQMRDLH